MKRFMILLCLLPVLAYGQTEMDAQMAMKRYAMFFDGGKFDKIYAMFESNDGRSKEENEHYLKTFQSQNGRIVGIKYMGKQKEGSEPVFLFKTIWKKGNGNAGKTVNTTSFTLNKKNQFHTFQLIAPSTEDNKQQEHGKKG